MTSAKTWLAEASRYKCRAVAWAAGTCRGRLQAASGWPLSRLPRAQSKGAKSRDGVPALIAVVLAWMLMLGGALPALAQRTETAKALSKRMMCLCGCNQVLGECNHVGCSMSTEMLRKLDQRVARGEPADLIIQSFVQEYGQRVLAEPPATGFTRLAWILPPLATVAGLLLVVLLVWRWRMGRTAQPAAAQGPKPSAEVLARARQQADQETDDLFVPPTGRG